MIPTDQEHKGFQQLMACLGVISLIAGVLALAEGETLVAIVASVCMVFYLMVWLAG